jgi:two-component system response regulator HydG
MAIFQNYRWPGNLRNFKTVLRAIPLLTQGDFVEKAALPMNFFKMKRVTT